MIAAPPTPEESERLATLDYYEILDSEAEQDFDEIVELAAQICEVPISLVSLVDSQRQWFKAKKGLEADQTPREQAFCAHALLQPHELMVVPDAHCDERFHDNPLVTGTPSIRFYAGSPLVAPNGQALGTLCVIDTQPRELTPFQTQALQTLGKQALHLMEMRRALRREAEYARELERNNREKDKFLSLLSHDLKGPVTAMQYSLEFVAESIADVKQNELFRETLHACTKMRHLTESLLDWAKLQTGKMRIRRRECEVRQHLREALDLMQHKAKEKSIDLRLETDTEGQVYCDRDMLAAILRNVLSNAIKFTPSGGQVRLSFRYASPSVMEIRIRDTGVGMSEEVLSKLFRMDELYTSSETEGEEGNGLGLLLCREFAQKNEGDLLVESRPQQGTTVRIHLPTHNPHS
jgi:signal transduction histidine kinase